MRSRVPGGALKEISVVWSLRTGALKFLLTLTVTNASELSGGIPSSLTCTRICWRERLSVSVYVYVCVREREEVCRMYDN